MVIDSHQHFWKFDPGVDTWITAEMKVLQRNFEPPDLKQVLLANNIDGCVAVQSRQTITDTVHLLKLAGENSFIRGVVGWVDLLSKDLEHQLSGLKQFEKLKGFRHIVQSESPGFMMNPLFIDSVKKLKDLNFTYDLLIKSTQLQEAAKFVRNIEDTPIVVDHLAKPNIANGEFDQWKSGIKDLARGKNIHCKLSGMVTEAKWKGWKKDDFFRYVDVVLEYFGADRIMFGSDWPVCLLSASYEQQLEIIMSGIERLRADDRAKIMGLNAVQFYNLK